MIRVLTGPDGAARTDVTCDSCGVTCPESVSPGRCVGPSALKAAAAGWIVQEAPDPRTSAEARRHPWKSFWWCPACQAARRVGG